MSCFYSVYELLIESDFDIPDLPAANVGDADVRIELSRVEAIKAPSALMPHDESAMDIAPGRWQMDVRDTARLLVTGGRRIEVHLLPGIAVDLVIGWVLGSALAALLQQRGITPIHASAVVTPFGALLIAGRSGAGKSTLQAAFGRMGLPMLADDVSGVTFDGDRAICLPAFGTMRLWQDAIDGFGMDAAAGRKVQPEVDKYRLPVAAFHASRQPIGAILVLQSHNQQDPIFERLGSSDAFQWLDQCTYRRRFYAWNGMRAVHFRDVTRLAASVPVAMLSRRTAACDPDQVAALVLDKFTKMTRATA